MMRKWPRQTNGHDIHLKQQMEMNMVVSTEFQKLNFFRQFHLWERYTNYCFSLCSFNCISPKELTFISYIDGCVFLKSFFIFCKNSGLQRTSIAVMAIPLLAINVLLWAISVIAAAVNSWEWFTVLVAIL